MKSITTVQRNSYWVHRCEKPDKKIFKVQSDKFLVTKKSDKFATQSMRPNRIHPQNVQRNTGTKSQWCPAHACFRISQHLPWQLDLARQTILVVTLFMPVTPLDFFIWITSRTKCISTLCLTSQHYQPTNVMARNWAQNWHYMWHRIKLTTCTMCYLPLHIYKFFQFIILTLQTVSFQLLYFFQSDDMKWGRSDKDNL